MSGVKTLLQIVVDDLAEIFGRRDQREKLFQRVEVRVIEALQHGAFDGVIKISKVADHPGFRIDLAADGHVQGIIVAVPMRVVALAVNGAVLLTPTACRSASDARPRKGTSG